MPLTTLDPNPALVLVDLQKGIRNLNRPMTPYSMDDVIKRSAELAAAFRRRQFPVVLVSADGQPPGRTDERRGRGPAGAMPSGFADIVDELDPQPSDLRIIKQRWGAFIGTPLDDLLRENGVTQVVVTGVATSIGAESTARSAYEYGYNVVLVTDAMTTSDAVAHTNSVERIFPKIGETTTTSELLDKLGH